MSIIKYINIRTNLNFNKPLFIHPKQLVYHTLKKTKTILWTYNKGYKNYKKFGYRRSFPQLVQYAVNVFANDPVTYLMAYYLFALRILNVNIYIYIQVNS